MNELFWAAFSSLIAFISMAVAFYQSHRRSSAENLDERIEAAVAKAIKPVHDKQVDLDNRLDILLQLMNRLEGNVRETSEKTGSLLDRMAILETKVEVFWKSVAMDAAKIIHSPNPERKHVDDLLDAFMGGTLTDEGAEKLRVLLRYIMKYEPGDETDFPINQGEQLAAAILLRTMEHKMEGSKSEPGQ
jgi:hypothetical protein